jgi:hypothetical protein
MPDHLISLNAAGHASFGFVLPKNKRETMDALHERPMRSQLSLFRHRPDRYERRALSRRQAAIKTFDAVRPLAAGAADIEA